jgi:hypothetical protein
VGLTAARYAPKALHEPIKRGVPVATAATSAAAGRSPAFEARRAAAALHSSKPGQKFVTASRWAKKNPRTALTVGAGLKGAALATGVAARYRGQEASGLSHEIGTTRGVRRGLREGVTKAGTEYTYLSPMPTRIGGDGNTGMRGTPIKPLDAMAASNLANIPYGRGSRMKLSRRGSKQENNLRRSFGQQMQTSFGVGRAIQ